MAEELPVHEKIKVLKSKNLFKTDKWWKVVTLQEAFGNKEIAVYLWRKRDENWIRKQKFTIKDPEKWEGIKKKIDEFAEEL